MLMFCAGDGELEVLAEMLNAKIKYWVVPVHTHLYMHAPCALLEELTNKYAGTWTSDSASCWRQK